MQIGPMHEALKPICWLLGKWKSISAEVKYPTIKTEKFCELLEFETIGQPLINFKSTSWYPETGAPKHFEYGFLRPKPDCNLVAFVIAMNPGVTAIDEGKVCGNTLSLTTQHLASISFVREPLVVGMERSYKLNGEGKLEYQLNMATCKTEMTLHYCALYEKMCEK